MSRMGNYLILIGEAYQKRHPEKSWETIMNEICFSDETEEIKEISDEVFKQLTEKEP